jgi:uncharacterized protein YdhG (YjbR/CyaY superfamily)
MPPKRPATVDEYLSTMGYETSKGTIRFPLNDELPLDLVRRIVELRVRESESR